MMSDNIISTSRAEEYYKHEREYYTQNMTNHDRWHGTLAETIGLKGELSEEQFRAMLDRMEKNGKRERAGLDCTFSAPKSVSLMMAKSEATREEMIALHQKAVAKVLDKIEVELLQTRSNGKKIFSRNMICSEFLHELARPTEQNGNVPDLDLHSHCIIFNETFADGKTLACDYGKIMDKARGMVKELGLVYRQELAEQLQDAGYKLEVTSAKDGFFEIKGFDRETIEEYSNRRDEIEKVSAEHNIKDSQKANLFSRQKKSKGVLKIDGVLEKTRKELFTGRIEIEKGNGRDGNERFIRDSRERSGERDIASAPRQSNITSARASERQEPVNFAERPSLSDLPVFGMDAESGRSDLFLSSSAINSLAKLQSTKVRNAYLQRAQVKTRNADIDEITKATIKRVGGEKFAFTVPELRWRIMAAGVTHHITHKEAQSAMDRAQVVKLGHIETGGKTTADVYLTTEENIQKERDNIERMIAGKGTIKSGILSMEESTKMLAEVEAEAKQKGLKSGSFSITSGTGEQATAIHHILTCEDKYVCVDGLAGTGKTTMMERLKWIADKKGITINGACFTGKAADGLQNESKVKSRTIHAFLNALEKGEIDPKATDVFKRAVGELATETLNNGHIPPKDVPHVKRRGGEALKQAAKEIVTEAILPGRQDQKEAQAAFREAERERAYRQDRIENGNAGIKTEWDFSSVKKCANREIWAVDEAGLVDMHLMDQLQKAAEARGAQILLLGDPDQLPPVGAGEPMKQMEQAGMATAYLTEIRRQKDLDLLKAVQESVKGDHLITFEKLDKAGNYREVAGKAKRHEAIKNEMTKDTKLDNYKDNLLLVSTNDDRKRYNKEIRQEFINKGEIEKGEKFKITVHGEEREETESRYFAEGDRVIFTANDNKVNVKNGTMAQIVSIARNNITAKTDTGEIIKFNMEKYNSIDHAYAVTNYKAQGMTVQKVVADMNTKSSAQNRNALYVDISRAKCEAVVFTDEKITLERQTKNFAKKITGKDFAKRIETMRAQGGVKNNDRYHAPDQDRRQALEKALKQIKEHTIEKPGWAIERENAKKTAAQEATRAAENGKAKETPTRAEKAAHIEAQAASRVITASESRETVTHDFGGR